VTPATLRGLRLLVLDVDGVLTDGGLYYTESGEELKRFDVRDGQGIVLLHAAGVRTALVTARWSTVVERRARELADRILAARATPERVKTPGRARWPRGRGRSSP
jgi:YrbI family 3-deoxy-D-manno-octulosonate 8-phosphate phosphatase